MDKKGLELMGSKVVWLIILLIFALLMLAIYAGWDSMGRTLIDTIFGS